VLQRASRALAGLKGDTPRHGMEASTSSRLQQSASLPDIRLQRAIAEMRDSARARARLTIIDDVQWSGDNETTVQLHRLL
jgi:hypothetical protein